MKIKLSKSQWRMIGQKTGWMKKFQDAQSQKPPQLIGPPKIKPRLPPINTEDYETEDEYIKHRRPLEVYISSGITCDHYHPAYVGERNGTLEVLCDEKYYSYETILMDYAEEYATNFEKRNSNRRESLDQTSKPPKVTKTAKDSYTQIVIEYTMQYDDCDGYVYLIFECDMPHDSW